jgi:hypothetical protein
MLSQTEMLNLITAVVSNLDCRELVIWLTTIKTNRDPRWLPHYEDYQEMFTEQNANYPTVHLLTQMAFNDLAQVKLTAECEEL